MIERDLQTHLQDLVTRHPVLTLTGPRQSGKTTLAQQTFPHLPYVSLEAPARREFALEDPLAFLARYPDGAILDEVQRTPELPSYLQEIVDADPRPGRFVLTGSRNLALLDQVSQSLAGRSVLAELLPLSLAEVRRFPSYPEELLPMLWSGGYPRIHDRQLPPQEWLASYVATYVERDVRDLLQVGDLLLFQTFLRMCAGRTGQLLNLSSLAADCGITQPTARAWLSVLEASYVVHRLPPLHANLGKRLIKTPKLYFSDSGLVCYLLGIESPEQLDTHPLRGAIFETWVVGEVVKQHCHSGRRPRLFFYRDRDRLEVDLLIERAGQLTAIEIKSGRTPSAQMFAGLRRLPDLQPTGSRLKDRLVVYGGDESQKRSAGRLLSWRDLDRGVAGLNDLVT